MTSFPTYPGTRRKDEDYSLSAPPPGVPSAPYNPARGLGMESDLDSQMQSYGSKAFSAWWAQNGNKFTPEKGGIRGAREYFDANVLKFDEQYKGMQSQRERAARARREGMNLSDYDRKTADTAIVQAQPGLQRAAIEAASQAEANKLAAAQQANQMEWGMRKQMADEANQTRLDAARVTADASKYGYDARTAMARQSAWASELTKENQAHTAAMTRIAQMPALMDEEKAARAAAIEAETKRNADALESISKRYAPPDLSAPPPGVGPTGPMPLNAPPPTTGTGSGGEDMIVGGSGGSDSFAPAPAAPQPATAPSLAAPPPTSPQATPANPAATGDFTPPDRDMSKYAQSAPYKRVDRPDLGQGVYDLVDAKNQMTTTVYPDGRRVTKAEGINGGQPSLAAPPPARGQDPNWTDEEARALRELRMNGDTRDTETLKDVIRQRRGVVAERNAIDAKYDAQIAEVRAEPARQAAAVAADNQANDARRADRAARYQTAAAAAQAANLPTMSVDDTLAWYEQQQAQQAAARASIAQQVSPPLDPANYTPEAIQSQYDARNDPALAMPPPTGPEMGYEESMPPVPPPAAPVPDPPFEMPPPTGPEVGIPESMPPMPPSPPMSVTPAEATAGARSIAAIQQANAQPANAATRYAPGVRAQIAAAEQAQQAQQLEANGYVQMPDGSVMPKADQEAMQIMKQAPVKLPIGTKLRKDNPDHVRLGDWILKTVNGDIAKAKRLAAQMGLTFE